MRRWLRRKLAEFWLAYRVLQAAGELRETTSRMERATRWLLQKAPRIPALPQDTSDTWVSSQMPGRLEALETTIQRARDDIRNVSGLDSLRIDPRLGDNLTARDQARDFYRRNKMNVALYDAQVQNADLLAKMTRRGKS
jgi:hypothetical protein